MGDVRTERGDLAIQPMSYTQLEDEYLKWQARAASWQARAEQAEKDVARLTLECEASRAYASNVVNHANEYLARAEQLANRLASENAQADLVRIAADGWKKDAEDKAVLIAELTAEVERLKEAAEQAREDGLYEAAKTIFSKEK